MRSSVSPTMRAIVACTGTGFNGVRAVTQNVYGDVSAARKFLGVIVRNRDEGIGLHALKGVSPSASSCTTNTILEVLAASSSEMSDLEAGLLSKSTTPTGTFSICCVL